MEVVNGKIETAENGVTSTVLSLTDSNIRGIEMASKILPPNSQNKQCSIESCATKCYAKNLCEKHYARRRYHGDPNYIEKNPGTGKTQSERFWSRVSVTANPDKCWEWTGRLDRGGYGSIGIKVDGIKHQSTNRVAYHLYYGQSPKGRLVCHTCDNRKCCNPHHLYLGTHLDNNRDAIERGRAAIGERAPNAILNNRQVHEMRILWCAGVRIFQLAQMYGCSFKAAESVVKCHKWRHLL